MGDEGVKFLSTRTKGQWLSIDPTDGETADMDNRAETLRRILIDALQSEHFAVFCGLGTSLCVVKDGTRVAPTMLDLWNAAEAKTGASFEQVLERVHYPTIDADGDKDIELLLSKCQLSEAFESHPTIAEFIKRTEALIVEECSFLTHEISLPVHETFLRRIARRSTRAQRTQLFTTNYDLCFEYAASRVRFIVVDGFSHTNPQQFDSEHFSFDFVRRHESRDAPDYIPNVVHLYKLHGSVDWERNGTEITKSSTPSKPVLIYPRHTKFESSYEPPFLDLMGRFQTALRRPNCSLLVIGFGFNDKHLAEPILSAVRSNVGLKLTVIDPSLEQTENPAFVQFRSLVDGGDPRISLIAAKFEEFVSHLPDLVAVTEEERHMDRIKGAGK